MPSIMAELTIAVPPMLTSGSGTPTTGNWPDAMLMFTYMQRNKANTREMHKILLLL